MDPKLKKILRGISLEIRRLLEGRYDERGEWVAGDLEERLKGMGVWRGREPKPVEELPHLSPEDKVARRLVDGYLKLREEAGVGRAEAVGEFVRESAYTWANRLFALRCMEARGIIDEVVLQKETYGWRSMVHNRFAKKDPQACLGEDDGLFSVFFEEFGRRAAELPDLFDPKSPAVALKPSVAALKRIVALLSGREAARGQDSASDDVFVVPDAFGWVYQYYQDDEKERVDSWLKTKKDFKCEGADIVPKTALYTETYMVEFLVQNSLGGLWMAMYPDSKLCEGWNYYVRDADCTAAARRPVREITLLDPAQGSGHFHLGAFDIFYAMYEEEWARTRYEGGGGEPLTPRHICSTILNHNLFGIDIDQCAVQIACALLWMKAKERAPDLEAGDLTSFHEHLVATNIRLPKERNQLKLFLEKHPEDEQLRPALELIFLGLRHADELGSLLQIEELVDAVLRRLKEEADRKTLVQGGLFGPTVVQGKLPVDAEDYGGWKREALRRLQTHLAGEAQAADAVQAFFGESAARGLKFLDVLSRRYDVVAANPPYLNTRSHGSVLFDYFQTHYRIFCEDLYAVFIGAGLGFLKPGGSIAFVSQQSFFFTDAFKEGRKVFRNAIGLTSVARLGAGGFEEISGEVVNTLLFVGRRGEGADFEGVYFDVIDREDKSEALQERIADGRCFRRRWSWFDSIPDSPLAFWLPEDIKALYARYPKLGECVVVKQGLATTDNPRFIRSIWESASLAEQRWFPFMMSEGGDRWYGEYPFVLDWQFGGARLKALIRERHGSETKRIYSQGFYFRAGLTFGRYTGADLAVRFMPEGFIFDNSAPCAFSEHSPFALAAFLNSALAVAIAGALNPTSSLQVGDFSRLPMILAGDCGELAAFGKEAVDTVRRKQSRNLTSRDCVGLEGVLGASGGLRAAHQRVVQEEMDAIERLRSIEKGVDSWVRGALELSADWEALVRSSGAEYTSARTGRQTAEDIVTHLIVRLLGHRWPVSSEPSAQVPAFVDQDGIVPVSQGGGETPLIERVRNRLAEEFTGGNVAALEAEFEEVVGVALEQWVAGPFFERHVSQFRKRPIAWQIETDARGQGPSAKGRGKGRGTGKATPVFSCLVYYHRLDEDLLPKIRTQYVGALRSGYEVELRTLERLVSTTPDQQGRKLVLEQWVEELKAFDEKLEMVSRAGFCPQTQNNFFEHLLRQYAINDALLSLTACWLRRLEGQIGKQKVESRNEGNPLSDWLAAADATGLHTELAQWVEEAFKRLDYFCAVVAPEASKESEFTIDPMSRDLAPLVCARLAKTVERVLELACDRWWHRFEEIVLDPLKEELKRKKAEQEKVKEELELDDVKRDYERHMKLADRRDDLKREIKRLRGDIEDKTNKGKELRSKIEAWACPEATTWEDWLGDQPLFDGVASLDGKRKPPKTIAEFVAQESAYAPDINDGVRVNIAPLQKADLLHADVLDPKDVEQAIAERAEWRADERRWVREGKLPRPGWWPEGRMKVESRG